MSHALRLLVAASLALAIACGAPADPGLDAAPPADGGRDGAPRDDGGLEDGGGDAGVDGGDHPMDGGADGGGSDAGADGGEPDARVRGDGGTPLEIMREGWCAPLAHATCVERWSCGCGGSEPAPDPATCMADAVDRCMSDLESRIGTYLVDGQLSVDAAALETCRRRLAASFAGCGTGRGDVGDFCVGVLVASIGLGEGCVVSDALCAGGAGSCVSGACEALPAIGASCADYQQCAPGATCRADVCVALSEAGAACARDGECADDLLCVAGTCRAARAALGAACEATAECVAGAECMGGTCAATSDLSCAADADCPSLASCFLVRGSVCQDPAPIGSACSDHSQCAAGAYCDRSTFPYQCAPVRNAGEPCADHEQCEPSTICDHSLATPSCVAVGGPGATCHPTGIDGRDGCSPELACVSNVCAPRPGDGETCADDGECAPGLVCRTISFERRCRVPGSAGETCWSFGAENECADGLFCDSTSATCIAQRGTDEECSGFQHECVTGLTCLTLPDSTRRCRPLPTTGTACSGTCVEGLVCAEGVIGGVCDPLVCGAIPR